MPIKMRQRLIAAFCFALTGTAVAFATGSASAQTTAPPPILTFVFEETVTLSADIHPGKTAMGERNIIPITGGTFEGPGDGNGIRGTILPGGWDWQLIRADGCMVIKADYMLKTDDGAVIDIVNSGPLCPPEPGKSLPVVKAVPVFEPPLGKYEWLAKFNFISTVEPVRGPAGPAVHIRIYRID